MCGAAARAVFKEAGFRSFYYNVVMGTGGRDGTVNGILGRNLSGNMNTFYQLDNDPTRSAEENTFNNTILRVEGDPMANAPQADGLRYIPRVNGQFSVPVLTLHGLGDLYVPFVHEQLYRKRAIANGSDKSFALEKWSEGSLCRRDGLRSGVEFQVGSFGGK